MMSSSTLSPSGGGRGRPGTTTIVLIVVLAIVLFGAGFGIARLITGGSGSPSGPTALPCVTTSARPGLTLPKPGTVTANVYNATQTSGLAKRTATTLGADGFLIGKISNDPLSKTISGVGELRYGPKGKQNAQLLAYYLVGATLVQDTRADATVDLVLGDGYAALASSAAVQAQLAKPVVSTSGPGCSPSAGATAAPTAPVSHSS